MVHTSEDVVYLHHLKNILEAQGIESIIKNDRLKSVAGEIPMNMVWPELWVVDGMKQALAKMLIKEFEKEAVEGEPWICENCGEQHAPQFNDCWNCQAVKAF